MTKKRDKICRTFKKFEDIYGKELSNFAFLSFGSALTLYRDKKHDDDDIDFCLWKKDIKKLKDFLIKNNFKVVRSFKFKNTLTEITIKFESALIDFFVIGAYEKIMGTIEYQWYPWGRIKSATIVPIYEKTLKFNKTKSGIKYIASDDWFVKNYGKNWNRKLTGLEYEKDKKVFLKNSKFKTIDKNDNIWKISSKSKTF